ncbi:MAG TPA: hypothetical protein VFD20_06460 [Demequina sp.]|nr:hypothetical protein [Demequina sp.]
MRKRRLLLYQALYQGGSSAKGLQAPDADKRAGQTPITAAHHDALRWLETAARRNGHPEDFQYCAAELVAEDCFNTVFEAGRALPSRSTNFNKPALRRGFRTRHR